MKNQKGFHLTALLLAVVVIGVIGFIGWKVLDKKGASDSSDSVATSTENSGSDCSARPTLQSPADLSKATSVLYPGQTRGGDYKPHGGLRFDSSQNADITVKAPLDAKLTLGSRYIEQGEQQVLLEFQADCDIFYRFDHLMTLSDTIQKAIDSDLPAAKVDDSRTTNFKTEVNVKAGDVIATAIGFKNGPQGRPNVSFDFGLYDKSKPNGVTKANNDYAQYGVCWLSGWFSKEDSAKLASLPAGDARAGKTSDYCK